MSVVGGTVRTVGRTVSGAATATTAAAGAVGGAAVSGIVGGVTGAAKGIQKGLAAAASRPRQPRWPSVRSVSLDSSIGRSCWPWAAERCWLRKLNRTPEVAAPPVKAKLAPVPDKPAAAKEAPAKASKTTARKTSGRRAGTAELRSTN